MTPQEVDQGRRVAAPQHDAVVTRRVVALLCMPVEDPGSIQPGRAEGATMSFGRGIEGPAVRRDAFAQLAGGMIGSMRVKTSVTIDERVLKAIDKATTRTRSRSRVLEDAAREFLARRARAAREARDLGILNESADALNEEMDDVLAYQADV